MLDSPDSIAALEKSQNKLCKLQEKLSNFCSTFLKWELGYSFF